VKAVCEIARAKGIETIVDGAHSFAQFDFQQKDLGCDYFGTSLHKWLYAPKGTGMLYVKRDKDRKALAINGRRSQASIRFASSKRSALIRLRRSWRSARRFFFTTASAANVRKRGCVTLSRYWMKRLKDVPKIRFNTSFDPNQSCAIANVHIEGTNPEAVAKYLFDKQHIFTVPIVHEEFQGIRITPNVYTTSASWIVSATRWN